MGVLQSTVRFEAIVVMMQAEVAERLVAEPGTKAYGSLSVIMQYRAHVEIAFNVPRTAFIPQPNGFSHYSLDATRSTTSESVRRQGFI